MELESYLHKLLVFPNAGKEPQKRDELGEVANVISLCSSPEPTDEQKCSELKSNLRTFLALPDPDHHTDGHWHDMPSDFDWSGHGMFDPNHEMFDPAHQSIDERRANA